MTIIDYYTRFGFTKLLTSRESNKILKGLKKFVEEVGKPETLISDNAKEMTSEIINKYCKELDIKRHLTSPYRHEANGRVERFNKTVMGMVKKKSGDLERKIKEATSQYNTNHNRSIGMTPKIAFMCDNEKIKELLYERNVMKSKYSNEFGTGIKEKFIVNEKVLIRNEPKRSKLDPEYIGPGIINKIEENDSYLIEWKGKILKRNHEQLKKYEDLYKDGINLRARDVEGDVASCGDKNVVDKNVRSCDCFDCCECQEFHDKNVIDQT